MSRFADTALRLLAAPSVLQEARDEALRLAEAGGRITVQEAKELIEAKRAQVQAEQAEQSAHAAAELAQRDLAEEQARSRTESERLTQRIVALQEEMAALSKPEVEIREVEKEVVPPEITTKLERLQVKVQELTEQRDNLSQKAQQLGADLETLREAREAEREQALQAIRIRQRWQKVTGAFQKDVRTLLGHFPTLLDTQMFEAEEWERLARVEDLARRFLGECRALREAPRRVIVDALET